MHSRDYRRRLRRATQAAQARAHRMRAEIERRRDPAPRPGDLLGFPDSPESSGLWAVLDQDDARGFLLVATDLHPFAGTRDVAVSPGAACGALCLRCGFEAWLDSEVLETAKCVSMLEPEDLQRARDKRVQIEAGSVTGSVIARDSDGDPEYQDWLEAGPVEARTALLAPAS